MQRRASTSRPRTSRTTSSSPVTEVRATLEPGEVRRTEIVVEMDDSPGVLASIGEILGEARVNIVAAAVFTAKGKGIIHLVVDESQAALTALKRAQMPVSKVREVLSVTLEDRPGELGKFARRLADHGMNISALYVAGERFGDKELIVAIEPPTKPPAKRRP